MNYKRYIQGLENYIVFSSYVFLMAVFVGYYVAQNYPHEIYLLIEELKTFFSSIKNSTSFEIFTFILWNNVSKLLLLILLGIFAGLLPIFSLFSNGLILGVFAYFVSKEQSWQFFFLGILPHGIIEIPVLIISSAIGVRIGKVAILRIFGGQEKISSEILNAIKFFIVILVPLLLIAAFIEAYLTPIFISLPI
ncbi:stage II sporulation protein M [Patescibacteria group bacterium]|nr:stage II sporulation protein M [Patescibacteria group bacterium]